MNDLRNLDFEALSALMVELKQPKFRAKQLYEWIHQKFIQDLVEAKNLGGKTIDALEQADWGLSTMETVTVRHSQDGTEKFLFRLADGESIECVLMRYRGDRAKQRNTLCVSTQVGCAMGCRFCATGQQGFTRQLSTSEILNQVYLVDRYLQEAGERVGNIVFMGMGEPFANYEALLQAIHLLNDARGVNIGARRMTVSTCGLVPQIRRFADENLEVGLAISLHETSDEKRDALMPVNQRYPLAELMEACHYYQEKTKRRITFEYALIDGVNTNQAQALALAKLLKGLDAHVNLIPVNPVVDEFKKPNRQAINDFLKTLEQHKVAASIREEKGADIEGACGQLKSKME